MIALVTLVFTSCEIREFYDDAPFLGTWEAVQYGEGRYERNLYPDEYHRYVFYRDGTGVYSQSDGLRTRFTWDERYPDRLYIHHSDGLDEYYYYDFDERYLLLSQQSNFYTYFVYEPSW